MDSDDLRVGILVEGRTDAAAATTLLASRQLTVDRARIIISGGKHGLDARIPRISGAARHLPWLVLSDRDEVVEYRGGTDGSQRH